MRKIIIDTDTAGDDALALLLALSSGDVEVLGITVAAGNVDIAQAVRNALMVTEVAGKRVPVYKGAETSFTGVHRPTFSVYGKDGMGDQDIIHPTGHAQALPAEDFMIETFLKHPGEVELVTLGPVTNLALAMQKNPAIVPAIRRIWSMGTPGMGKGNATPVAEFNVYKDAEAYAMMLSAGIPITIIGFDMCCLPEAILTPQDFDRMKSMNGVGAFYEKAFRFQLAQQQRVEHRDGVPIPDPTAMACMLWPELMEETIMTHALCVLDSKPAYGQVIFYEQDAQYDSGVRFDRYDAQLVTKMDAKGFHDKVMQVFETFSRA